MSQTDPKRRFNTVRVFVLVVVTLLALWVGKEVPWSKTDESKAAPAEVPAAAKRMSSESLPGEVILKGYGTPSSTVERDLEAVGHAFENLTLLIKGGEPFRMGANEEFAAALRGANRVQLPFLRDDHPAFNAAGQIVDRWGTPLFFHVEAANQVDIRSAGPDGEMWTADDVQRLHSGRFHRGAALPGEDDSQTQR